MATVQELYSALGGLIGNGHGDVEVYLEGCDCTGQSNGEADFQVFTNGEKRVTLGRF